MTVEELIQSASKVSEASIVAESKVQVGGVDPLGLRQINFDLMDRVLPGLNNVAEKLRPFVLMTWAWRRVRHIVAESKRGGATDEQMRDFVDRIEAIYAWSQFLIDPKANIPGGEALKELIHGEKESYKFGGKSWENRRNTRRTSTGLISPLNYGPGLRSMGWLIPTEHTGVFASNPDLDDMLDVFEAQFEDVLEHPAFNQFGSVKVEREDVERWGELWSLADLTEAERIAGLNRLAGPPADPLRRFGLAMVEEAIQFDKDFGEDPNEIRRQMAEPPAVWLGIEELYPCADAWRRLQTRQLFRLSLEGLFYWTLQALSDGPSSSDALANRLLQWAKSDGTERTEKWLARPQSENPVDLLDALQGDLLSRDWSGVASNILRGLSYCLVDARSENWSASEAFDRLPLRRAQKEAQRWKGLSVAGMVTKMIEVWVLAQHAYWCVGRGLADARGNGKTLLRLRIVMEEGGWTLTPGAAAGRAPVATPDRLRTAISLLGECRGSRKTNPIRI